MSLRLRPITVRRSTGLGFVASTHRRLPRVQGAMWGVSVVDDSGDVVGVALVGHPSQEQTTPTEEHLRLLRMAVVEGHKNACSMLYGACWRAALAMGCLRMDTFTHQDEPGTSLIASGWVRDGLTAGGEYSRASRPRRAAVDAAPKVRWWAPGSVLADGRVMARKAVEVER
jgi:hypothetical protein